MLRILDLNDNEQAELVTDELHRMRLDKFIEDGFIDRNWKAVAFTTAVTGNTLLRSSETWTLLGTGVNELRKRLTATSRNVLDFPASNKIVARTEAGLRELARLILTYLMPRRATHRSGAR